MHKAHERLGPVVRIAPNHISFSDPSAFKDTYGHGAPLVKDNFYAHVAAGNPSMANTMAKSEHSNKRRKESVLYFLSKRDNEHGASSNGNGQEAM